MYSPSKAYKFTHNRYFLITITIDILISLHTIHCYAEYNMLATRLYRKPANPLHFQIT